MTKLDASPKNHFEQQLREAINSGQVFEDGWTLNLRRYGIGSPDVPALHTNIEIHGPEGGEGDFDKRFYASIDTFTYVGEETSLVAEFLSKVNPYQTGLEMRMAVDMERETSNWVATDANLVEDHVLASGSGVETIAQFAKLAEQAQEFNNGNSNYALLEFTGQEYKFSLKNGFEFTEEHANSNSGPLALLEQVYGKELANQFGEVVGPNRVAPGINDDISSLFKIDEVGYFEALPEDAYGALADPDSDAFSKLVKMMEILHPDSIKDNGPDNTSAPALANSEMKPM